MLTIRISIAVLLIVGAGLVDGAWTNRWRPCPRAGRVDGENSIQSPWPWATGRARRSSFPPKNEPWPARLPASPGGIRDRIKGNFRDGPANWRSTRRHLQSHSRCLLSRRRLYLSASSPLWNIATDQTKDRRD